MWLPDTVLFVSPAIHLGQARVYTINVTRYMAMLSEVRRYDRRGATALAILYKYALHVREQAAQRLGHM